MSSCLSVVLKPCCWSVISITLYVAGELYVAVVASDRANARILNVDPSAALAISGVVGYLDHSSVPGSNKIGICGTCDLFATEEVIIVLNCNSFKIIRFFCKYADTTADSCENTLM
jgi:xanthine dehydrogenase molybdopterin-binding subunit B